MRCVEKNTQGDPCGAVGNIATDPDGAVRCIWHSQDPHRKRKAEQARRRGAETSRLRARGEADPPVSPDELPPTPTTQEQCEDYLRWIVTMTASRRLGTHRARELTNSINTLHKNIGARLGLEKKAAELQRQLNAKRKPA